MEDDYVNYKKYKSKTLIFNIFLLNINYNFNKKIKKKYGLIDFNQYNIKNNIIINNKYFNLEYDTIYNLTKKNIPFLNKLQNKNNSIIKICVLKNYKNVCCIGIIIKNKLQDIFESSFIQSQLTLFYNKLLYFDIKQTVLKNGNINLIKGILLCSLNNYYFNDIIEFDATINCNLFTIFNLLKPYYFIIKQITIKEQLEQLKIL
jgi:hypothetical protein